MKSIWQSDVFRSGGRISPGATVTFTLPNGDPAELWSDIAGDNPIVGNSITANAGGYAFAYLTPGLYKVTITINGQSKTYPNVLINSAEALAAGDNVSDLVNDSGYVTSSDITSIVTLTQAEYDELTPDAETLYIVVPA